MARKKGTPQKAPEYKKKAPGKAKDGSTCYTRQGNKGAYVTCTGTQKSSAKPKATGKPKSTIGGRPAGLKVKVGTLNKGKPPTKGRAKPKVDKDLLQKVLPIMASVGKENPGVPLKAIGGETMGFPVTEYRDGSGKKLAPNIWIRLRKKPLTLTEFKTFLTDGRKISREDAKEIKEFLASQKKLKPYLAIRGRKVGDTVVPLYEDASRLATGDDGQGNRSVSEVKKNYKKPSDVEILFSSPKFWDDHQNSSSGETANSERAGTFSQREIFSQSGYRQGDRGGIQIGQVRGFWK